MLKRLDRAVPNSTSLVILQPGGNDRRNGTSDPHVTEIQEPTPERTGDPVMMLSNGMLCPDCRINDGIHLTQGAMRCLRDPLLQCSERDALTAQHQIEENPPWRGFA